MAKKVKRDHVYAAIDSFIEELYANGTVGKWNVEKKLKQAKRAQQEAVMEIAEQKLINETLEEIFKKKKRHNTLFGFYILTKEGANYGFSNGGLWPGTIGSGCRETGQCYGKTA